MWSRIRLDVGWSDLAITALRCTLPADREAAQQRLEEQWSPGAALACHAVRSGFDLLLTALAWPTGHEILFSALNVKGMVKIAERHGLQPVPVDLRVDTMGPDLEALERAITPRSRAILVAHLFGARLDLVPLMAIARRHGLMVIEDCAQAFAGTEFRGHPESDVTMFSFGPLKTATALGGALLEVRDRTLLDQMRSLQQRHPVQTRSSLAMRCLKFALLKALTWRWLFGAVAWGFRRLGRDYEDPVAGSVRGVAKLGTSDKLRHRPCAAQLALLERRIRRFSKRRIAGRRSAGERLRDLVHEIASLVPLPGQANAIHDYWVFPVLVNDPAHVIAAMRAEGFDVSDLPRSRTVAAPADRPKLEPTVAREALSRLLLLPCYAAMPDAELERQAAALARASARSTGPHSP